MSETSPTEFVDLLGRLLGPIGPELTCDECFAYLDRYVDLEVAGHDAETSVPGMQAHLEGCPACAEDHGSLRELIESERWPPRP